VRREKKRSVGPREKKRKENDGGGAPDKADR